MITMKTQFCTMFDEFLFDEGFSYDEMVEMTGLSKSQLVLIKCQNGEGITLDRMIEALIKMDVHLLIEARKYPECSDPERLEIEMEYLREKEENEMSKSTDDGGCRG